MTIPAKGIPAKDIPQGKTSGVAKKTAPKKKAKE